MKFGNWEINEAHNEWLYKQKNIERYHQAEINLPPYYSGDMPIEEIKKDYRRRLAKELFDALSDNELNSLFEFKLINDYQYGFGNESVKMFAHWNINITHHLQEIEDCKQQIENSNKHILKLHKEVKEKKKTLEMLKTEIQLLEELHQKKVNDLFG